MMSEDHYPPRMIAMLEAVWGEGFLSPGGPEEVARIIGSHDISGKAVLDIGCGAGGIDITLVRDHGAGHVCGMTSKIRSSPMPAPLWIVRA